MKLQAKKSLGQHFLRSEKALSAIVDAGDIHADDIVLEIGPGEGVLTERLLKLAGKVIAVEKDPRSVVLIQEKFAEEIKEGKLDVIEKDILDFNQKTLSLFIPQGRTLRNKGDRINYKVIANIPYYITGAILEHFLQTDFQPELMVLLVQKEVAQRIIARDKKESILSMSVKVYGDPTLIQIVPRGAFAPAPTVDSAILLIDHISKEKLEGVKDTHYFNILKHGFAHKRKKLIKNLEEISDRATLKPLFESLNIDENTRAEDLSLDQWIAIAKLIK